MASPAKTCFLLFLFTITLSSHQILARDSQFFNKVPSSNNNNGVTQVVEPNKQQQPFNKLPEEEPNFIPENENSGYGLYGHESGQLPPSTTNNNNGEPYKTTNNIPYNNGVQDSFPANAKYLPKNYNTEAYVTEPEGYTPTTTSTSVPENNHNNYNPFSIPNSKYLPKNYNTESYVTEPEGYTPTTQEHHNENNDHNYYYNGENGYHNDQQQEYSTSANANNYYYDSNRQQQRYNTGANNNYNSFAQRDYTTTGGNGNNNYDHYSNGAGNSNGYQKQGMSDTRFLENGKYFYDVNLEKSTFNPNDENTREFGYGNRGYYSNNNNNNNNNMNTYEYKNQNYAGFQNNHDQFQNFQDEEDLP